MGRGLWTVDPRINNNKTKSNLFYQLNEKKNILCDNHKKYVVEIPVKKEEEEEICGWCEKNNNNTMVSYK